MGECPVRADAGGRSGRAAVPRLSRPGVAVMLLTALALFFPHAAGAEQRPAQVSGAGPEAAEPAPAAPETSPPEGEPAGFEPLDLPSWVVIEPEEKASGRPWILVVDDAQCPYCMQLHLALAKARQAGDAEIAGAVIARIPYPLAFHDQAAHIVNDAFCLEAARSGRHWSAAKYLDWLMIEPWLAEPGWDGVTIEELQKDGGFFDTRYGEHKILSSRRRDYQTRFAKAESACAPDGCPDAECEKLCAAQAVCRAACPAETAAPPLEPPAPARAPASDPPQNAAPGEAPVPTRQQCLDDCAAKFSSARYRQYSRIHLACLLAEGPGSAHAKTAEAVAWAAAHKVPGTPTVYAGHPSIGFRLLGDSDDLKGFLALLRQALARARQLIAAGG